MTPPTYNWDPGQYLKFGDERSRGLLDLLNRVGSLAPGEVVDLGCGPGNSTAALKRRWPEADIRGIDNSPEMIQRARATLVDTPFEVADLRDWLSRGDQVDVLFTNATLQWVPGHLDLLNDLVAAVRPGGSLAIGVPGNFDEPSHRLRQTLAATPPYARFTQGIATPSAHEPGVYLRALRGLGCTVDAWETTYLYQLKGADAVFEWISGTSAGPVLQVLPFRRVFVVAQVA